MRPSDTGTTRDLEAITRLALPIALAQFGLVLTGLVDVAILGRTSPVDLAGASIGRSIAMVASAFGIGAGAALEPLAAQALGAREPNVAWRALRSSLLSGLVVTAPCAALGYAATFTFPALGFSPALVEPARAFLLAATPGVLVSPAFYAGKTFLQAHQRTRPALVASIAANVVNLVVCSLLVLGDGALVRVGLAPRGLPALGAFGAGLAMSIAHAVLAAGVLYPARALRPSGPRADGPGVATVLRLGTPVGLQIVAEMGVFSLVAVLAGRLGEVAAGAHQIAIGLASFTFMGALGVSGATAVRVGHAVGEARSPRRAGLVGIALGAAFMACSGAAFVAAPRTLVALFTTEPETIALGTTLLGVAAAFQLFDGVQVVAAGALRGAGDVRFPFVANVAAHWLVGLPLALFFGFHLGFGAKGLWWGLLAGLVLVSALLLGRFVAVTRRHIARV